MEVQLKCCEVSAPAAASLDTHGEGLHPAHLLARRHARGHVSPRTVASAGASSRPPLGPALGSLLPPLLLLLPLRLSPPPARGCGGVSPAPARLLPPPAPVLGPAPRLGLGLGVRVVFGGIVVDEPLRLLLEGVRLVIVGDLELGLVKWEPADQYCDSDTVCIVTILNLRLPP